jgi:hypothetical protein
MTPRRDVIALSCTTFLLFGAAHAGAQTQAQCTAIVAKRAPGVPVGADACLTLATLVVATSPAARAAADAILKPGAIPVGAVFSQRDLQARHPQQPATGGTPAQGQAVPDVQPAGVASGTIAAVGTDAGDDALAALSINPALLFLGDEVTRQLAQYSRFADLTMFVPVSGLSTTSSPQPSGNAKLKYWGARLRLNVTGLANGSQVWNRAEELLRNRISQAGRDLARVRDLFTRAPNLEECVTALLADPPVPAAVVGACGAPFTLAVDLAEAEALHTEFERIRRAADARYFGADIRLDIGDPTLGAVEHASGKSLFAGLAYGRRLANDAAASTQYGFRSRVGVRHATLDETNATDYAVEGGIGFDLARHIEAQEISAAVAVEFRYGNGPATMTDQFQTDFAIVRGSVLIPVTSANSFSINFGIPFAGDVSPILSVNFNWGLLLSNALRP